MKEMVHTRPDPAVREDIRWKEDDRPPRFGWAPGGYLNECRECKEMFIGDKRAWHCADCAHGSQLLEIRLLGT